MARDKRGQEGGPDIGDAVTEMDGADRDAFVAGPTSRNEAGDVRRAAAKAIGVMGASPKVDADLAVDPDGGRPKRGSKAGLHSFSEVPPEKGGEVHVTRTNAEIAEEANVTARKSPASRSAPEEPGRR